MTDRTYHSKVILFGEYSMIFDATALMIPLRKFSARWRNASHLSPEAAASNSSLQRFADYLSTLDEGPLGARRAALGNQGYILTFNHSQFR